MTWIRLKEAGYDVITPVIVCNTPQFPKMECISGMEVKAEGDSNHSIIIRGWG